MQRADATLVQLIGGYIMVDHGEPRRIVTHSQHAVLLKHCDTSSEELKARGVV